MHLVILAIVGLLACAPLAAALTPTSTFQASDVCELMDANTELLAAGLDLVTEATSSEGDTSVATKVLAAVSATGAATGPACMPMRRRRTRRSRCYNWNFADPVP